MIQHQQYQVTVQRFLKFPTAMCLHSVIRATENIIFRIKKAENILQSTAVITLLLKQHHNMFFYIFIVLTIFGTAVLSFCGIELIAALTAVLSCLSGIGPTVGLGASAVYYGALPAICKWTLGILMLIGRLEIYAVLVLIHPFHVKMRESERMFSLETLERDGMIEPFVRDYDD